jgi:thymidine kinase
MREDHLRIICEVCQKSAPDVERYAHRNRMIEGKSWLCIKCADEHKVDDECRTTHQSPQAKSNLFRRQYGKTKKFA